MRTLVHSCALLVLALAACTRTTFGPSAHDEGQFDGERAYELAASQLEFGARIPGTEAHRQEQAWILARLAEANWRTETQSFPYGTVEGRNLIGRGGPEEGDAILLGAHYDTRPRADRDGDHPTFPVPGANDGASGVAVLLELARVLDPSSLDRPLWLVFFDAEDGGSLGENEWIAGSTWFADTMEVRPTAVVIVDMVGDADLQLYYERNSDPALAASIWETAADLGHPAFIARDGRSILDDHSPFLSLGIPAVDIIDFDYPYWHTTQDTLDRISPQSLEQVGRTLEAWLAQQH
jgi:Zn-dependent M28 family amino/carboxypeptidase